MNRTFRALVASLLAATSLAAADATYTATRLPGGQFDLQFTGLGPAQFALQSTTNFIAWTNLALLVPTNGVLRHIDAGAAGLPLRFYRVASNVPLVTLAGQVRDTYTLAPVTNALIGTTLDARTALTDGNGLFSLVTLRPATNDPVTYAINISAPGYNPASLVNNWPARLDNLDVLITPPPANDNFTNRTALTGALTNASGLNFGASFEAGEPTHYSAGGKSVWWTWTAPAAGMVFMDTGGSGFDTLLAAYTGAALGSLALVDSDDDSGPGAASFISFSNSVANRVYQIAVDGVDGAEGTVQLNIQFYAPPANNNFANAITLSGPLPITTNGNNVAASRQTGEPDHWESGGGGKSVWWRWTAPATGTVTISTAGSADILTGEDLDTVLAIYTGTSFANLQLVDWNDSGNGFFGEITFEAQEGTTYQIAVDSFSSTEFGTLVLTISPP